MQLSPTPLNRLANSCLGVVPAVAGIAYVVQADHGVLRFAAGLAVIAFAVLAVRGYRLGVTCEHARMTVRGYLRTRVIDRERISEVTDFPAVRWTAPPDASDGLRSWRSGRAPANSRQPVSTRNVPSANCDGGPGGGTADEGGDRDRCRE